MNEDEEFIKSLYDHADEKLKDIFKEQKANRDELLSEIANIMLTYTIINNVMKVAKNEIKNIYNSLSDLINNNSRTQAKNQANTIQNILTNTTSSTYNYYSYNAGLKDVQAIIDSNFKGKHFSDRVWNNESEVAKHLHKNVNDFLNGKVNVNQIKKDIEKTYNNSAYEVKRLTETEVNRCSRSAFDRFCFETGVKKVRYNATLDSKLCSDCGQYHDKVFDLDSKIEVPRHPLCRCFYTIDDNEGILGEKKGKDADSEVNWELVNSNDYKNKFTGIGRDANVDDEIYNISKRILKHRDGTKFEDLYIVDLKTGKTITVTTQDTEMGIKRTDKLERILNRNNKDYVIIHNHPHSSNFSDSDLKTLFSSNSVSKMMAIGHDGTIYLINSKKLEVNIVSEFKSYYNKIKNRGYSVQTSEDMAFKIISEKFGLGYERR